MTARAGTRGAGRPGAGNAAREGAGPGARSWDAALVADDLTGAGDSAVHFADRGWRTMLAVGPDVPGAAPPDEAASVLATSTDVRAAAPDHAREVVRRRVAALVAAGTSRVYLKVDSTLRGSVSDQVQGALAAWTAARPDGFAVVCPAYPAMGRTVEDGRARVHGEPLEDGAAGADPVTPVRTSVLTELLPGARRVAAPPLAPSPRAPGEGDVEEAAEVLARDLLAAADGGERLLAVDAADDAAVEVVARAVVRCGGRALPVGSAGLAMPVARLWWPSGARPAPTDGRPQRDGPVLVLVTSVHPVARAQVERLAERPGTDVVRPGPDQPGSAAPGLEGVEGGARGQEPDADVVVVLAPLPPEAGAPPAGRPRAAEVAAGTAALLDRLLERGGAAAVVAVGGDGAAALLERLGASGLEVREALAEGVPSGVLVGGRADGLPFASKAGGFGGPGTLLEVVDRLRPARATPRGTTTAPPRAPSGTGPASHAPSDHPPSDHAPSDHAPSGRATARPA